MKPHLKSLKIIRRRPRNLKSMLEKGGGLW